MPSDRPNSRPQRELLLFTLLLVLAGSLLALVMQPRFFWRDDYQTWWLPVWTECARAWKHFEFPLVTPMSWAMPDLAGEYQPSIYSPFIQLMVVLFVDSPLPLWAQAAAMSIAHLLVLAGGSYRLARENACSPSAAALAGVAMATSGHLVIWGASAWPGSLTSFAWIPWLWWSLSRLLRQGSVPRAMHSTLFLYLILTAGWPYSVLMAVLVTGFELTRFATRGNLRATLGWCAVAWIWALLLATPALWALLDYVSSSGRPTGGISVTMDVPWKAWIGLLVPHSVLPWIAFGAIPEPHPCLDLYAGGLPLLFVLGAAAANLRRAFSAAKRELIFAAIAGVLASVPQYHPFQLGFRWLPLFHLSLVLAGAKLVPIVLEKGYALFLGTVAAVLAASGIIAGTLFQGLNPGLILLDLAIPMASVAAWALLRKRGSSKMAAYALPAFALACALATYYPTKGNNHIICFEVGDKLRDPAPLELNRLYFSAYGDPNRIPKEGREDAIRILRPANFGMHAGISMLNGYTPIGSTTISRFLGAPSTGLMRGGLLNLWKKEFLGKFPEPLFSTLGVDGVILSPDYQWLVPKAPEGWQEVFHDAHGTVYHRLDRTERIGTAPVGKPGLDSEPIGAKLLSEERGEVAVAVKRAPQDRIVFLRRAYLPGYVVEFNGEELAAERYQGLMPAAVIRANQAGILRFTYLPRSFELGRIISVVALCSMLVAWLLHLRRRQVPD